MTILYRLGIYIKDLPITDLGDKHNLTLNWNLGEQIDESNIPSSKFSNQ